VLLEAPLTKGEKGTIYSKSYAVNSS